MELGRGPLEWQEAHWQRAGEQARQGQLLILCEAKESGSQARLLQATFAKRLGCEVLIGSDDAELWREEAMAASRGVVLLQTRSVLHHPLRLLQLYVATQQPLVCVKVIGGGYDFDAAKRFLHTLPTALPPHDLTILRSALEEDGAELGQLARRLSSTVPNSISVSFAPGAEPRAQSVATPVSVAVGMDERAQGLMDTSRRAGSQSPLILRRCSGLAGGRRDPRHAREARS